MSAAGWLDGLRLGLGGRRLPMMLQTEAAECGLACIAMVAAHHGLRSDLPTLRQRFPMSLKGATMADLVRLAGHLQLNSRALRAEMSHLPDLVLPCILHWDLNHFVVLKEVSRGVAVIHVGAGGGKRGSGVCCRIGKLAGSEFMVIAMQRRTSGGGRLRSRGPLAITTSWSAGT